MRKGANSSDPRRQQREAKVRRRHARKIRKHQVLRTILLEDAREDRKRRLLMQAFFFDLSYEIVLYMVLYERSCVDSGRIYVTLDTGNNYAILAQVSLSFRFLLVAIALGVGSEEGEEEHESILELAGLTG